MKNKCGICGERTTYTHIKIPPTCVELMENNEEIDLYDIIGAVKVWFCPDDWENAKRMVSKGENPLGKVSAQNTSYESRTLIGIMARKDVPDPSSKDFKGLEQKMLERSIDVIENYNEYTMEREIIEAKIILESLHDMGVTDEILHR